MVVQLPYRNRKQPHLESQLSIPPDRRRMRALAAVLVCAMAAGGAAAKVDLVQAVLNRLYPRPPIPLNHRNGFTFLVAVVLSAQTTDGKVNEVTNELFAMADNPRDMARIPTAEVQRVIQSVGLAPRKAQFVTGLSQKIVDEHGGEVPNTLEGLEGLPGVGRKTASVILSQLHGVPSLAVDTHVHRLALRWGLSKEQKDPTKVQRDLCAAFPEESWDRMIYFGREYCPAKGHEPSACPVCSWIHRPTAEAEATVRTLDLTHFAPQKKVKGLVYYNDRVQQLLSSPGLVSPTAHRPSRDGDVNEGEEDEPVKRSSARKRKASGDVAQVKHKAVRVTRSMVGERLDFDA